MAITLTRLYLAGAALSFLTVASRQAALSAAQQPLSLDQYSTSSWVKKPIVETEALQDTILVDNLLAHAQALYAAAKLSEDEYNHPTRVIGSAGHNGTLAYIRDTLANLDDYYDVTDQYFPAVSGNIFSYMLVLGNTVPKSTSAMTLTPPTRNKEPVRGHLVLVDGNGCDVSDYPAKLRDNVALIKRGMCSFGTKSELAGAAGAIAAVVYNHEEGSLHGTLGVPSPNHVATFGISHEDAKAVVEELKAGGDIDTMAYMDADVRVIRTANIIAQTARGDPDNCVMLGGHSDGVAEGPGINDDGTGSMSVLEVAVQLTNFEVNNCVRFAWWSGEEEGLLGSDYYVAVLPSEEKAKIRLFMDYDMMASPNFAYQVYDARDDYNPRGSEALRNLYVDWYIAHDLNHTLIPFDGRSDYDGFIRSGIPAGGFATGAEGIKSVEEQEMFGGKAGQWYDPCYHQDCDDLDNLNMTAWEFNTKLIAHSVATFAVSFEGFPTRDLALVASAESYGQDMQYHGHQLVV